MSRTRRSTTDDGGTNAGGQSTKHAVILLGVPILLATVVGLPLGFWLGEHQWLCAAVAVALIVPVGVVTLLLSERLARRMAFGQVIGLFVGTFVRLVVGFGGAALVFVLTRPTFHADPLSFWLWVLGTYLTTLVVETVLLAGSPRVGSPSA